MRKDIVRLILLSIFFNLVGLGYSQCPVNVSIQSSANGPVCRNTVVDYTAVPTNGGNNPDYYWLVNGDTLGFDSTFSVGTNGAHIELVMISSGGCPDDSAYASTYLINVDEMVADYEVVVEECNQPVADVKINSIGGGGVSPYSYYLYTDDGAKPESSIYEDLPLSAYPVVITDSEGCMDTSWIDVSAPECPPVVPAEVFTPNDDGYNDTWVIQNILLYPKNKVFVFDRWGQRVYHKEGYDNNDGWDAKYIGGDMPVTSFFYIIELEFEKQDTQIIKGAVSIMR